MLFLNRKTTRHVSEESKLELTKQAHTENHSECEEPNSREIFFSVKYHAKVIINKLGKNEETPVPERFFSDIPELFNIASTCAPSDLVRFRRMSMVPGDTGRLAAFLMIQAERINGLTRYIIDEASKDAIDTETVSAGGFTVRASFPKGTLARVQLFLPEYGTAAYAIARAEEPGEQEKALIPPDIAQCAFFRFIIIRDQDRAALQSAIAEIERKSLRERRAAAKKNQE